MRIRTENEMSETERDTRARRQMDESDLGWFVVCRACKADYHTGRRRMPAVCSLCGSHAIATMIGQDSDYDGGAASGFDLATSIAARWDTGFETAAINGAHTSVEPLTRERAAALVGALIHAGFAVAVEHDDDDRRKDWIYVTV